MGFPEPDRPLDDPPPARPDATPGSQRPDWLVGADEGAAAEVQRTAGATPGSSIPVLRPLAPPSPIVQVPRGEAAPESSPAQPEFEIQRGMISDCAEWGDFDGRPGPPATRHPKPAAAAAAPRPAGFDFDDLDEPPRRRSRPRLVVAEATGQPRPPTWWQPLLGRVISDRRTQMTALILAIVVISAASLASYNSGVTSVGTIRRNPGRFDGKAVKVRGRVGEVFPVGSSYAFNLHQGRDTIVVFTRSRVPIPRQHLIVTGSVSAGVLEGQPRAALFEEQR